MMGGLTGSMFVNGLQLDVTSAAFNMFTLLKTVRKELEIHDIVAQLKLSPEFTAEAKAASIGIVTAKVGLGTVGRRGGGCRSYWPGCGFGTYVMDAMNRFSMCAQHNAVSL